MRVDFELAKTRRCQPRYLKGSFFFRHNPLLFHLATQSRTHRHQPICRKPIATLDRFDSHQIKFMGAHSHPYPPLIPSVRRSIQPPLAIRAARWRPLTQACTHPLHDGKQSSIPRPASARIRVFQTRPEKCRFFGTPRLFFALH